MTSGMTYLSVETNLDTGLERYFNITKIARHRVKCNSNKAERGFVLQARATKPLETQGLWCTEVVTNSGTNVAHCRLTSEERQILITLRHNS